MAIVTQDLPGLLHRAIENATACTVEYDSGIQVCGKISAVLRDRENGISYLQTAGPTQLSFCGEALSGHGTAAHAEGFGSPVGKVMNFGRCLSQYSSSELKERGLFAGASVELDYLSGINVHGMLRTILRKQQRTIVLSFDNCKVTRPDGQPLFEPEWGVYDLAVGSSLRAVVQ